MKWTLEIEDVARIAQGATLLGAGGGGDPYISLLAARQIFDDGGRDVNVIGVDDVDDDALILTVAGFGAPTVGKEKLFDLDQLMHSLRTLEKYTGRKADALIAVEMGGGNALVPILAAAASGLPVVNGDGMGRAFPELQMTSYALGGVSPSPFAMADEHLNSIVCEAENAKKGEAFARIIAVEMGLHAFLTAYAMTGAQARDVVIPDTLTLAYKLGTTIENAKSSESPIAALIQGIETEVTGTEVVHLIDGKVTDLWRSTEKGFAIGWCDLVSVDDAGLQARIEFQNEYLAFTLGGIPKVLTPDLICLVDSETAEPIPTPDVRYGQRVTAIGLSCNEVFRSEEALEVVGPGAFDMEYTYAPIEELARLTN